MWTKIIVVYLICICNIHIGAIRDSVVQLNRKLRQVSTESTASTLNDAVCTTWECMKATHWIARNINSSVDPCDDFYEFACGRFGTYKTRGTGIKSFFEGTFDTTVESAKAEFERRLKTIIKNVDETTAPKHFTMLKTLYDNCMDRGNRRTYDVHVWRWKIHGPRGWPVVAGNNWEDYIPDINIYLLDLVNAELQRDEENLKNWVVKIYVKDQILDRAVLRMGFDNEIVQAYYDYMVDVAIMMGAEPYVANNELKDALLTEIEMAKDTLTELNRTMPGCKFDRTTMGEFTAKYPHMKKFIYQRVPRKYVDHDDVIMVEKSVPHIDGIVTRTSHRTLANLVQWHQINKETWKTNELKERADKFNELINGLNRKKEMWKQCVWMVRWNLGLSLGALYYRTYVNQDMVNNIDNLDVFVLQKMYDDILDAKWLDDTSRFKIIEKVELIAGEIGFLYKKHDDENLTKYYKDLELPREDVEMSISLIRNFKNRKNISVELKEDTFYDSYRNMYETSAMYTLDDYYNLYRPAVLNYAALGSVIGHEMAHSLDDVGQFMSVEPDRDTPGAPSNEETYRRYIECILYQYGNYTVDEVGLKVNGYRTLLENVADNFGAGSAYGAYRKWENENSVRLQLPGLTYTQKQMFWISLANTQCNRYGIHELLNYVLSNKYSPAKYRVNGVLSNRPEFAQDFQCKSGSRMNPKNKCILW